jgi:dTDP-4-amino-4,6-dideoxygalactose transaminase
LISNFGYATFVKNRLDVFRYLSKKNIQIRPLICGNMGQQPFLKNKSDTLGQLPNAKFVDKYGVYLPNHAKLKHNDIKFISKHFLLSAVPIFFK